MNIEMGPGDLYMALLGTPPGLACPIHGRLRADAQACPGWPGGAACTRRPGLDVSWAHIGYTDSFTFHMTAPQPTWYASRGERITIGPMPVTDPNYRIALGPQD